MALTFPFRSGGRPAVPARRSRASLLLLLAVLLIFPFIASQFGNSWVRIMDVALLYIMLALGLNVVVGFAGLLVGVVIGLAAAIISALRPGSRLDVTASVFALGGIAVPSFWQALIFVYVFAVLLHWVPPSGYTAPSANLALSLKQLALPAIVLGTHSAAVIMRQGRSALIEVMGQDYIATARAKG